MYSSDPRPGAYKVEPGPGVAGDPVSSARFALLLLLLVLLACSILIKTFLHCFNPIYLAVLFPPILLSRRLAQPRAVLLCLSLHARFLQLSGQD